MKVKVKFRDTEFGLFEPSFLASSTDGHKYRASSLDFTVEGIPRSQLVLAEGARGKTVPFLSADAERLVYASLNDGVYWIIERILDSERECGEEIEIEYEGEDMEEKTIEVPAGTSKVTLNIERKSERPEGMTLRQALLATPSDRAVIVRVVDRPQVGEEPLAWEMLLPAIRSRSDNGESRRARTTQFASCELCDASVLLDERVVRRVDVRYNMMPSSYCVVFEVANDA